MSPDHPSPDPASPTSRAPSAGGARGRGPSWAPGYRHLSADVAPVDLRFRERPEDFVVEELAGFEASGSGTHLVATIEKRGLSTVAAVRRLAAALGRAEADFGFAGRKDAGALSRQRISIEHVDPDALRGLELPGLRVLAVERHDRKLRLGQLGGNRFRLILRGIDAAGFARVEQVLERVGEEGLPNYYGAQRFGRGGGTWRLGELLVRGDFEGYVRAMTSPEHAGDSAAARELARVLVAGSWRERRALVALAPRLEPDLAAVARQVARRPRSMRSAARAVPLRSRRFHLSALQSCVFNRVVAARMGEPGGLGRLLPGDLLREHGGGNGSGRESTRLVRAGDLAALAPRAAALEVSPTGPLPGHRVHALEGRPAELEQAALAAHGLSAQDFAATLQRAPGARRPLRVPLQELELSRPGGDGADAGEVRLGFVLPSGSYATTLLEELRKEYAS